MDEVPISKGILYQKYANVRIAAGAFGLSTTARSRYIYIYTLSSWEMSLRVVPVAFEITLREAQAENPAAPAGPFLLGWVFWSSHWTKQTGWFRAARAENDQTYGPYMDPYGAPETMSHPYPTEMAGLQRAQGTVRDQGFPSWGPASGWSPWFCLGCGSRFFGTKSDSWTIWLSHGMSENSVYSQNGNVTVTMIKQWIIL